MRATLFCLSLHSFPIINTIMNKNLFIILAAMLFFFGCNKSNQFKVTLNIDDADNQSVYLFKNVDGKSVCIDSAVFAGKNAVMKADFDDPLTEYCIKFDKSERCEALPFFTENQNTTFTGNRNEMQKWTVKGCPIMDEWMAYRESLLPTEEKIMALYNESNDLAMAGDTVKAAELFGQVNAMMDDYTNMRLDYIKNHPDSFLAQYILDQDKEDFEFEDVREIADKITTESTYSESVKEYVAKNMLVQVGQPFIDFTLQTVDGKDVNLGEVIKNNKVTMIDFWASWCGPCRAENPNVKAAYEKYHAKGLEIIGVSVDQDEAAWLKAVEADALPWTHVRDVNGDAGKQYMVMYIPSSFLFDQNGVIIAKNLRGEELEAKLAEVLP